MKTQKAAVVECLLDILSARDVEYEMGGDITMKSILTPDDLSAAKMFLVDGFNNGEIVMSDAAKVKYIDQPEMKSYVSSLINNWVRKLKDFNGGQEYKAKNPGSRAGSGDEQIKSLKGLLKIHGDNPESVTKIKQAITDRLAIIKPTKTIEINVDSLPDDLKYLVD